MGKIALGDLAAGTIVPAACVAGGRAGTTAIE